MDEAEHADRLFRAVIAKLHLRCTAAALVVRLSSCHTLPRTENCSSRAHTGIDADLAAAKFGTVLLADAVIGIQRAGIGQDIEISRRMLRFDHPAGCGVAFTAARGQFGADFGGLADAGTQVDGRHIGARAIALVGDDRGADADRAIIVGPGGAQRRHSVSSPASSSIS